MDSGHVHNRCSALLVAWMLVAVVGPVVLVGPSAGAAESAQPAFYTWQAPGEAWTAGRRVVALTFDDGPGPFTPQVLSVLAQYHVPATFFEIGSEVEQYPEYTAMVAADGGPVEDHAWSHPDLATLSASEIGSQIDEAQAEIRSVIGEVPACVRPPDDGCCSTVLQQVAERNLTTMSYSVDPRDWTRPGVTAIVGSVVGAAFPGAVVDLHDGGGTRQETVAALPRIITGLRAEGYGLRAEGYGFLPICGYLTQRETSTVVAFGRAPAPGSAVVSSSPFVGMAATPDGGGYWLVAADGGVFSFGAPFYGSAGGSTLDRFFAMVATSGGSGYLLAGQRP